MSTAGWFPDPDGTPGRYRYWDGDSWSPVTTDDPRTDHPGQGARRAAGVGAAGGAQPARAIDPNYQAARAAQPNQPARRALIIAAVLALLIIVAVGGTILWRTSDWGRASPPPPPSVSAWDDSSPLAASPSASPSPSPKSPSPTPSPSPTASASQVSCPEGDAANGPSQPADGRVHGGRLSFAEIDGYAKPQPRPRLSWFYGTSSQFQVTEPGWASSFTVGEVQRAGLFGSPKEAADHTLQCMITGEGFEGFAGRKDLQSKEFSVSGRAGWMIMTEVRVDRDDISVEGDRVVVIFVDDGRSDRMSGFVGLVPIGDDPRIALMDRVIKDLRVE